MTKQPKALRLADLLDAGENFYAESSCWFDRKLAEEVGEAADELRRLHEVNQDLLEALQRIKHHFDTDEYAWKIATVAIAKSGEQP